MTDLLLRELQVKDRLLASARDTITALFVERERARFTGRCLYCGGRCHGRVCADHRDLLQLDPVYRP